MTAKLGNSRVWWRINFREGGNDLLVRAAVQPVAPSAKLPCASLAQPLPAVPGSASDLFRVAGRREAIALIAAAQIVAPESSTSVQPLIRQDPSGWRWSE